MLVDQTPWLSLGYDEARCRGLIAPHLDEIVIAVSRGREPRGVPAVAAGRAAGAAVPHLLAVVGARKPAQGGGVAPMAWLEEGGVPAPGPGQPLPLRQRLQRACPRVYATLGYREVGCFPTISGKDWTRSSCRKSARPLLAPAGGVP